MKTIKMKMNTVPGYEPGQVIDVPVDDDGFIINRFLRRRATDALIDKCMERVKQSKEVAKS